MSPLRRNSILQTIFILLLLGILTHVAMMVQGNAVGAYISGGIAFLLFAYLVFRLQRVIRRTENMQQRIDELETLHAIWRAMDSFPAMETMLQSIARMVSAALHVDDVMILLYNQSEKKMEIKTSHALLKNTSAFERVSNMVFRTGQSIYCENLNEDLELLEQLSYPSRINALAAIPLHSRGKRAGVLSIASKQARTFSDDDARFLELIASTVSMVVSNHKSYQEVSLERNLDGLTGLYNRAYFTQRLQEEMAHAMTTGDRLYVLMIDVDRFKSVNDEYGHMAGDKVLEQIGAVLKAGVRKQDVAARYGGEEFALILPGACAGTAEQVANRVRRRLREELERHTCSGVPAERITLSIGAACYPHCADKLEDMMELADQRMYVAKRSGGDQYWYVHEEAHC